jgi:aspartyl-tRNA(Asn)/glutamyl-tRNA(Gln) amidotransferase subunit C
MDSKELYATAELANIELKPAELEHLQASVEQMVVFFEKMAEVDTSGLEPTTHAFIKGNRVRPDSVKPSAMADNILEQAPDLEDRFICIPNVL